MANKLKSVTLPANIQDRIIYAAHRLKITNQQNQAVLEFKDRLNEERLEKALKLIIEAEPVLGSSFIENKQQPYWKINNDREHLQWLSLEKTANKKKAVNRFLTTPLDDKLGQQVNVKLIRSKSNDTLCIKINHACCDGGGLKALQHLLAEIYTQLGNEKKYELEQSAVERVDQNIILKRIKLTDLFNSFGCGLTSLKPTWAFPSSKDESKEQSLAIRRLPPNYFKAIAANAKKRGVSVNDILLTAFYRALFRLIKPQPQEPKETLVTVDLRRYMHNIKAGRINNLSSALPVRLFWKPGETFNQTLERVVSLTTNLKKELPGLYVAFLFRLLSLFSYEQNLYFLLGLKQWMTSTGKSSPILSNVGYISDSTIMFDKTPVIDAYQVSPAIYAPGFMLGVCTYNNRLTFTVSYYHPGTPRESVEKFMDLMLHELRSTLH